MRLLKTRVLPRLLPILIVTLVLAGAVFLGLWAPEASSWPGAASTTATAAWASG